MIIEQNGFTIAEENKHEIASGSDVLEVWTGNVEFIDSKERAKYFNGPHTESVLVVSVEDFDGVIKYRFAFNDKYVDEIYEPLETLPSTETLYQRLEYLVQANG